MLLFLLRRVRLRDQSGITQQLANTSVAGTPTPAIPTPLASAKSLEQDQDVQYDNYIYRSGELTWPEKNYQRIRGVRIVPRRAEDVSALHLSQEGVPCVKEVGRVVYHKVKNDKPRKDCQKNDLRNLSHDAAVLLIYKLPGRYRLPENTSHAHCGRHGPGIQESHRSKSWHLPSHSTWLHGPPIRN